MARNYDTVATFYDRLARLVMGSAQIDAQLFLLRAIPAGSRLLIAGGGTGWILTEIVRLHPSGLTITYADTSAKMIGKARERKCGSNRVDFVTGSVEELVAAGQFDVVLTPFLFDNFGEETAQRIFSHVSNALRPGGTWLYCDFRRTTLLTHRLLLRSMYLFFRLWCGIEARQMPDVEQCFAQGGYIVAQEVVFMNGFIAAIVYTRQ